MFLTSHEETPKFRGEEGLPQEAAFARISQRPDRVAMQLRDPPEATAPQKCLTVVGAQVAGPPTIRLRPGTD
ncbi:MAG TPA: hypothetical protein VLZ81_11135, partial [Blastocatellia bacterium]|nr:hypothetical protein [Blastocatellia bacterium]